MLFKIDKSEQERVTGSLNATSGEQLVLSFSEDGREWVTYKMTARILDKILFDDRVSREMVGDPEVHYKRLNGHSFSVGAKTDED